LLLNIGLLGITDFNYSFNRGLVNVDLKAVDLITTTYEMSLSKAKAEGATYPITAEFRQEISKLLGTHNFNANTKNIKQIAEWMKKNKPRATEIETRGKSSPRGTETRPASSTRK
jgi:hypothetical protein